MKEKILIAMSGGVDSSVAAYLLQQQGYEVTGAFMKNWSDTKNKMTGECQWREERRYAMQVAARLRIKLITLDFEKEYKGDVVDKMIADYKRGITPNPDIDCNQRIKFPLLIKEAKKRGFNLIATGHYARKKKTKDGFELHRGKDETKDQSYFLYRLSQKDLTSTLFPIGDLPKTKVRELAKEIGFENFDKKGTVGICFIGKVNLREFLHKKIPEKVGDILDPEGKKIGEHNGAYYYTINQRLGPRHGFDLERKDKETGRMNRWYVAKKDVRKNTLTAAPEGHPLLLRKEMTLIKPHFIDKKKGAYQKRTPVLIRIRQVGELMSGTLEYRERKFQVTLKKPITGISEGQACVLYQKTKCIGGGEIRF